VSLPLSVTIITFNEEKNIAQTLQSVHFAQDIVVVDSLSTDNTVSIAKKHGARVFSQSWLGYGQQKNFAQEQTRFDWVLNIDADEQVSSELKEELFAFFANPPQEINGFKIKRKTFYCGKWIRYGGWYPSSVMRFANKKKAQWSTPFVHEALIVAAPFAQMKSDLLHYSFHSIEQQIQTNIRFAELAAKELAKKGTHRFLLLQCVLRPIGKFLETYFWKKGFLDGFYGLVIAVNAAHSMFLKYVFLKERHASSSHRQSSGS
jgi:glycosyltransferase involved in cell wall biosynthesis